MRKTTLGLGALLACSCGDPLKEAQNIEEPRVIGVRVSSPGDVAGVQAGEQAEIDVLAVDTDGVIDGTIGLLVCEAVPSDRGVPTCESESLFELVGRTLEVLPAVWDAPSTLELGTRVAVLGVVCPESDPVLAEVAEQFSCSGGESPLPFSFDTEVLDDESSHRNPDVSELTITQGSEALELNGMSAGACPAEPSVSSMDLVELSVDVGGAAEEGEELQLSHYATRGEFDRAYSFVEAEGSVAIEWEAGSSAGASTQFLVVRDGRGGVSWVSWRFCQEGDE